MHEAGLARGVVERLHERGLHVADVRLAVRGGQHDPATFEEELRTSLASVLPDQADSLTGLEIPRLPSGHFCPTCGAEFDSAEVGPACPICGAETLPALTYEQIEIVPLERAP